MQGLGFEPRPPQKKKETPQKSSAKTWDTSISAD